jgi:hypothetical protein
MKANAPLNLASILRNRRTLATSDPRMTKIGAETANAQAALQVDEAAANLEEKNAFSMAQNAALLDRGQRPVGGGTYAEMRRRKLGPRGMTMSGLGAANRAEIKGLRDQQVQTAAQGARSEVMGEYGLTGSGQFTPANKLMMQQAAQLAARRRGPRTVQTGSNALPVFS